MDERSFSTFRNGLAVLLIAAGLILGGWYVFDWMSGEETAPSQIAADIEEQDARPYGEIDGDYEIGRGGDKKPLSAVGEFESPFVAVANRLKPSVVNITVEGMLMNLPGHQGIPTMSGGSGVIVDERGYVLTNHHVVDNAESIVVTLSGGDERDAELVGTDPESDLALIDIGKVNGERVAMLGNSDSISIGDWAIAMGNPLGLDWTLTVGVVSAKGRSDLRIAGGGPVFQDFIQTDASINFGNSGGPLTNIHGEVIGINSATNSQANGIGFAIPINMARDVVAQLLKTGYVRRGYLGMVPTELNPILKEALGIDDSVVGVFVESVAPDTPAEKGGLEDGDVVIEMNGEPVDDVTEFRMRIANQAPGEKMTLTVIKQGETQRLEFVLAERGEYIASASKGRRTANGTWLGMSVTSLESAEARELNVEVESGVLVVEVDPDSPAAGKLEPGDVIVQINDETVETLSDWQHLTEKLADYRRAMLIKYYPQGRGSSRFIAVKP